MNEQEAPTHDPNDNQGPTAEIRHEVPEPPLAPMEPRQVETITPEADEAEPRAAPRIYVASLTDYNAGILHGEWIEASDDSETMQGSIDSMLAASPTRRRYGDIAEEWAIHDYEGFGQLRIDEYEPLTKVAAFAAGITEHGMAFTAWAAQAGSDSEQLEGFDDHYLGEWESIDQFAESMIDDYGIMDDIEKMVPEHIRPYLEIDIEALARDLQYGGDIIAIDKPDGGVWVFDAR